MLKFRGKMSGFKWQLLILIIFSGAASAQSTKELKDIFSQAESYYLYEEYDLANQLYILLETPDNLNIKYKIGICYLNIPGEKAAAIPYLEEAVKNASYEAKSTSFNEKKAPLDAYFYLGKAFMINNELEKGLNTLNAFNNLSRGQDVKGGMQNLEFIDQQIQACKKAIEFMDRPVELTKKMLGSGFAQGSMNENPAVSFDGNSIAYTERRGMVNVILYSRKERDVWQTPVDITQMLNAGEDCSTCAFNSNGTELFLYKNDMYDGNIYSSQLVNGSWTSIKKLNKNINTKFYESHASVSADGNKLYFTSNRDGGAGYLCI
jgi:tetratricopeptide (TPR) repeat protein